MPGLLPAHHQGVAFQARGGEPVANLKPQKPVDARTEKARLSLLETLNRRHAAGLDESAADPLLARIRAYELAAQMQRAISWENGDTTRRLRQVIQKSGELAARKSPVHSPVSSGNETISASRRAMPVASAFSRLHSTATAMPSSGRR